MLELMRFRLRRCIYSKVPGVALFQMSDDLRKAMTMMNMQILDRDNTTAAGPANPIATEARIDLFNFY